MRISTFPASGTPNFFYTAEDGGETVAGDASHQEWLYSVRDVDPGDRQEAHPTLDVLGQVNEEECLFAQVDLRQALDPEAWMKLGAESA